MSSTIPTISTTSPSAASTTTLNPAATSTGLSLPSSTVISIGLGFVAVAAGLVFLTLVLRLFKIYKVYRHSVRRGEHITFRETWRANGGWWGYFTSGLGGESVMVGAGGLGLTERERRWMEILGLLNEDAMAGAGGGVGDGVRPLMYEVVVDEKAAAMSDGVGDQEKDSLMDQVPLALQPYPQAPSSISTTPKTNPNLHLSVLILMPRISQHQPPDTPPLPSTLDSEVEPEIPDLVVGTTHLIPTITIGPSNPLISSTSAPSSMSMSMTKRVSDISNDGLSDQANEVSFDDKARAKGEVEEVEDVARSPGIVSHGYGLETGSGGQRRARWVKSGDRWVVEGIS